FHIIDFTGKQRFGNQRYVAEHTYQLKVKISPQRLGFGGKPGLFGIVHGYIRQFGEQYIRPKDPLVIIVPKTGRNSSRTDGVVGKGMYPRSVGRSTAAGI